MNSLVKFLHRDGELILMIDFSILSVLFLELFIIYVCERSYFNP